MAVNIPVGAKDVIVLAALFVSEAWLINAISENTIAASIFRRGFRLSRTDLQLKRLDSYLHFRLPFIVFVTARAYPTD